MRPHCIRETNNSIQNADSQVVTSACKQAIWDEPHDFIYLEIRNNDKYLEKVAELYRNGHSLRDIAKQIVLSKTKIRDLVLRAGIPLRTMRNEKG